MKINEAKSLLHILYKYNVVPKYQAWKAKLEVALFGGYVFIIVKKLCECWELFFYDFEWLSGTMAEEFLKKCNFHRQIVQD